MRCIVKNSFLHGIFHAVVICIKYFFYAHVIQIYCDYLASYINDPLTHHVENLNKTIKDDPKTFYQLVVDRSEVYTVICCSESRNLLMEINI